MAYTQSPRMTKEEIESLLKEAKTARFCSLNEDGTIHAVPVWYKYEKGRIMIGTPERSRKAKNVRRNKNVTILIDTSDDEERQPKGVIVYGKADLQKLSPMEPEAFSLFRRYIPENEIESYGRALSKIADWVWITVEPERVGSFDYEKDKVFQKALKEAR